MTQTTPTGVDLRSVIEPAFWKWADRRKPITTTVEEHEAYQKGFTDGAKWMLRASAQFGGIVPLLHRFIGLLESDEVSGSEGIEIK